MQDGIIKGTGNSRYLKTVADALTLYPTYEAFLQAMIAGTFPIDMNGVNATGWTQQGTALNKANLLADATASALGLTGNATVNQALAAVPGLISAVQGSQAETILEQKTLTAAATGFTFDLTKYDLSKVNRFRVEICGDAVCSSGTNNADQDIGLLINDLASGYFYHDIVSNSPTTIDSTSAYIRMGDIYGTVFFTWTCDLFLAPTGVDAHSVYSRVSLPDNNRRIVDVELIHGTHPTLARTSVRKLWFGIVNPIATFTTNFNAGTKATLIQVH